MSAHTPGPWAVEYTGLSTLDDFEIETATIRADHLVIAEVECHHDSVASVEANAKLIAAAPDLADALRNIQFHANDKSGFGLIWQIAAVALAKAGQL